VWENCILPTNCGYDLIAANRKLSDAALRLQVMQLSQYNAIGDSQSQCETVMASVLAHLRERYDYILIDCGLKHELLTINALVA